MYDQTDQRIRLVSRRLIQFLVTYATVLMGCPVPVQGDTSSGEAACQTEKTACADDAVPTDVAGKQHFISIKNRLGGVLSNSDITSDLDKANIWTLQLDYLWQLNSKWALGIDYSVEGEWGIAH